jgi:hypothetical protein
MPVANLTKISFQRAGEVCSRFELSDTARPLLREEHTPAQFLDALTARNCLQDAAKFLSQALPKQEAVWWACQCARSAAGPNPPPKVQEALAATEKWVAEPTDANRRAAMAAGEAASLETPAGCAALAAFVSGDSLGPPDVAAIPPAENLTGKTVAGTVVLATVVTSPEKAPEKLRAFVDQGLQIASGVKTWRRN